MALQRAGYPPASKVFNFTVDSGQLTCHVGSDSFALEAKTDHSFYFAADNSIIDFGSAETFDYKSSAFSISGKRIKKSINDAAFMPTSQQLKSYCGTFYSKELETHYQVYTLSGKLMIHHFRRGDFELFPARDRPNGFTSGIGTLDFYTDQQHISGFKLSGNRIRNIRFRKLDLQGNL